VKLHPHGGESEKVNLNLIEGPKHEAICSPRKKEEGEKNTERDRFTCVWSHRYDIINS